MYSYQIKRAFGLVTYFILRPHRKGHGIHSPFVFDFVNNILKKDNRLNLKEIKLLRKKLLSSKKTIHVEDFGAGSKKNKTNNRSISEIVRISSSSLKKGNLLYNLVDYYKPKKIIELGTCLGFGTLYMAKALPSSKIITVEGSKSLSEIAKENFNILNLNNINIVTERFDEIFPEILKKENGCDLLFIDGNHKKVKTLEYFNAYLPYAKPGSIVVLDDIRWSEGMYEAWLEICSNNVVNLSIDLFNTGIVFFNDKIIKQHFRIYY